MNARDLPDPGSIIASLQTLASHGTADGLARHLDVGSENFVGFIESELVHDIVLCGGSTCRFFEGPHGAGKSHILELIRDIGRRNDLAVVRADLATGLGLENWRLITKFVLEEIQFERGGRQAKSFPEVLTVAADTAPGGTPPTFDDLPHRGFAHAIARFLEPGLDEGVRDLLSEFLKGVRVPVSEFKSNGIRNVKDPLSDRNSESILRTALGALRRITKTGTMLLFDENERSFTFVRSEPPLKVRKGANLVRRFIDAAHSGRLEGVLAVFTVLPEFLHNAAVAYPALGARVSILDWGRVGGAWRWTVLPVELLTTLQGPEDFAKRVADRIVSLATHADLNVDAEHVLRSARTALEFQAGAGYRREVVRAAASAALQSNGAIVR